MPDSAPILALQRWIELEVVGRNLCPPLVNLARPMRTPQGALDWERLRAEITFHDLSTLEPGSVDLLDVTSGTYVDFMLDAVERADTPLSCMFILPDFPTNRAFDAFLVQLKQVALMNLCATPEARAFTLATYADFVRQQGALPADIQRVQQDPNGAVFMAAQVIEGCFNTIHFYGRRTTGADLADLPDTRGPQARYHVLARAPHFVAQVINPVRANPMVGSLNRPALHRRNTTLALETDVDAHEAMLARLRGGT
jgi:hypothetical protein